MSSDSKQTKALNEIYEYCMGVMDGYNGDSSDAAQEASDVARAVLNIANRVMNQPESEHIQHRSSESGQYVTKAEADANPSTTQAERG